MALRIFDTKSDSLREFHPADPVAVRMYVCGPTVYSDAHIGHARSYVCFDVMRRYLEYQGHQVSMVINITDIDDVIDTKAERLGENPESVAKRYEKRFLEDLRMLNLRPPQATPRVSESVADMIEIIEDLNENGYIYDVGGNYYFRVGLPGGYGQLTHESPENLLADKAKIGNRENPFDFVIWKKGKEGTKTFDASFGRGRPGWHIQCYSMMRRFLGDTIDIHGGGEDLKFPHHESNILLSVAHQGRDITNYHVHNGFITLGKEKMSKSLGNFVPLRDIFERSTGSAVRFYLLRTHYRETIDYDEEAIGKAQNDVNVVFRLVLDLEKIQRRGETRDPVEQTITSLRRRFLGSMDDDFDTSKATLVLLELVDFVSPMLPDLRANEARLVLNFLEETDTILGLTGAN
ncbi:MAG: cysteine--tRNA ligase [Thermoplasmata archaeon]